MIKKNKNENKLFKVIDKVNDEALCYLQAKNEKDVVRTLVFSGFFKTNRLIDVNISECEIPKEIGNVDVTKTLKELSIGVEDKAEKIKGDAKKKIIEETKKEE